MITNVANVLHHLNANDKLSHAYLLVHQDRDRLVQEALEAVQVLVCEEVTKEGRACKVCGPCRAVQSGNHPAVNWLVPDGASLKIAQMRMAIKQDRRMNSFTNRTFLVLEQADTLTAEAANSILKWVEEPAQDRLFLLLARSPMAVLPTLRSRCTILLLSSKQLWEEDSRQERFDQVKKLVLELGSLLATKDPATWYFASDRMAKDGETEDYPLFGELLMAFCRDAVAIHYGVTTDVFEQNGDFETQARALSPQTWTRLAMLFSGLTKRLKAHVNAMSLLESFLLQAIDTIGM